MVLPKLWGEAVGVVVILITEVYVKGGDATWFSYSLEIA